MVEVKPRQNRFIKADNGVITDRVTGLDWYIGPNQDNTWREAKAWGLAFYNGREGWHGIDYAYGRLAFAVRSRR
jgi:uncharacterized protein (DUF779 family)